MHSADALKEAITTAEFLFKGKAEELATLDANAFEKLLGGIDTFEVNRADLENGINLVDLLVEKAFVFPSKTEARKMVTGNAVSLNKTKVNDVAMPMSPSSFMHGKYLLVGKGKKENYLVKLI